MNLLRKYGEHAIFGAVDGLTVVLGVMLPLLSHPHAVVLAGVGAAIAEAVGMGAGEWLSDSDGGWKESTAIGLSTAGASIIPVLPFTLFSEHTAATVAAALIVVLAAVITGVRRHIKHRSWPVAVGETFGVLIVVAVCVAVCALALGGA